jgi:hypothetical protein
MCISATYLALAFIYSWGISPKAFQGDECKEE